MLFKPRAGNPLKPSASIDHSAISSSYSRIKVIFKRESTKKFLPFIHAIEVQFHLITLITLFL
jgi:hypothetical protein